MKSLTCLRRGLRPAVCLLALLAPSAAAAQSAANGHGLLSESDRAIFWGSPEDTVPEVLDATREDLENRHYLASDERNQHLYFPYIEGLGGGLIGVGSDQLYLLASVMRANLVWLADYDPWIEALHLAYFAFFEQAETIEAFLELWNHDNEETSRELLARVYAEHPDLALIIEVHDGANRQVHRRLRYLRYRMSQEGMATFLSDLDTYRFTRDLVGSGRVRPLVANLLDDEAYRGIGRSASELGVPIRAIYLSNAESYWSYTAEFRANMAALPVDERSVVLRARATKPQNGDYSYAVQPAIRFMAQLEDGANRVHDVWDFPSVRSPEHIPFSVLDGRSEE